jgi:integrase
MSGHIRSRSAGSFELRYRVDGKVKTETFRGSKKAAQARLRALMTAADRGEHVDPSKLTVAEHVRARIEQWQASGQIRARAAENYTDLLVWIAAGLGTIPVQRLTTLDVERWHRELIERGLAPRTVRIAHALLARALADAVKHRLVVRNVAVDQGAPKVDPAARVVAPDAEQVRELLAGLQGDPWHVPVLVALYTGMRRGEQLALRWSNVDLDGAKLRVVEALDETRAAGVAVKAPKSAAGWRTITLTSNVVDALRQHRQAQLERCLLLGLGRPPEDALVFPRPEWRP